MYVLTGPTVFVDAVDTRQWIDGARQVAVLPKNLDAYIHTHTHATSRTAAMENDHEVPVES